ncbi:MAG TPA: hypothetical protein VF974_02120 [Patescibacteria group bacterium]
MKQKNSDKLQFNLIMSVTGLLVVVFLLVSFFPQPVHKQKVLGINIACDISWNNSELCPKPKTPDVPKAGKSILDPVFGTTIVRVTDPSLAAKGAHVNSNSFGREFNADSTMFFVHYNDGTSHVFSNNSGVTADLGKLPSDVNNYDGAIWDPNNKNVFYAIANDSFGGVWKFEITKPKPLIINKNPFVIFDQMSKLDNLLQVSRDGNTFLAGGMRDPDAGGFDTIALFSRVSGRIMSFNTLSKLNNHTVDDYILDDSGRYVIMAVTPLDTTQYDDPGTLAPDLWYIWDWQKDKLDAVQNDDNDAYSRSVTYSDDHVYSFYNSGLVDISLIKPHDGTGVLDYPLSKDKQDPYENSSLTRTYNNTFFQDFYITDYLDSKYSLTKTMNNIYRIDKYMAQASTNYDLPAYFRFKYKDITQVDGMPKTYGQWFYSAKDDAIYIRFPQDYDNFQNSNLYVFEWRPMMEEIVQVLKKTDGTFAYRRLAHHRMYYDSNLGITPQIQADPTGSYVLFNSNWDGTLTNNDDSSRTDVFMLVVPPLEPKKPVEEIPLPNPDQVNPKPPPPPVVVPPPANPTQQYKGKKPVKLKGK